MDSSPGVARLATVAALLGAATMTLEISLTRLFSVLLFYHYVFLVLSVALLGLGLGGLLAGVLPRPRDRVADYASGAAALAALATVAVTILSARVLPASRPLLHGLLALIPFLFAGVAQPLLLGAAPGASARIYGADLVGAGLGTLLVAGLLYLGAVTAALGGAVLFAAAAFVALGPRWAARPGPALLVGCTSLLFVLNAAAQPLDVDLGRLAAGKPLALWLRQEQASVVRSAWDPFARTDVVSVAGNPRERLVFVDGAAGSPLPRYPADPNEETRRRTEIGSFPYRLIAAKRVLVVGSGGGIGVLHALLNGAADVTAVEVSPGVVRAVRAAGAYDGFLYDRPGVRVVTDEGRSFLERDGGRYDVIDLSLVVSLATAQSGYALTENYLFTEEAFASALDHLTDQGLVAVRVYDDPTLTRAFVTAAAALRHREASDAAAVRHLAVVFNPQEAAGAGRAYYPLLLISKRPLTAAAAQELTKRADDLGYTVIFAPFTKEDGPFGKVAKGEASLAGIQHELVGGVFTPTTDARPFFFEMSGRLPRPLVSAWIAVAVVGAVAGLGLARAARSAARRGRPVAAVAHGLAYFAVLGVAFMLVELALLARLGLLLGHPTIAVETVLAGLLLAGGAGSLASQRVPAGSLTRLVAVAAAAAAVLALAWTPVAEALAAAARGLPLGGRVAVALGALVPFGGAMGVLFPSGLRLGPADPALAWAVNGVASVLGAVLATTLALKFGYPTVGHVGGALYGAVALAGPWLLGRPRLARRSGSPAVASPGAVPAGDGTAAAPGADD